MLNPHLAEDRDSRAKKSGHAEPADAAANECHEVCHSRPLSSVVEQVNNDRQLDTDRGHAVDRRGVTLYHSRLIFQRVQTETPERDADTQRIGKA